MITNDSEKETISGIVEVSNDSPLRKQYDFKRYIKKPATWAILSTFFILVAFSSMLFMRTKYVEIYISPNSLRLSKVYTLLLEKGIEMKVSENSILVPQSKVDEVRDILLSEDILPPAGSDDHKSPYEIQMAADIRTMILQADNVEDVLVVVSDESISVMLTLINDEKLSDREFSIIVDIIRKSVPENANLMISISDTNFYIYGIDDKSAE